MLVDELMDSGAFAFLRFVFLKLCGMLVCWSSRLSVPSVEDMAARYVEGLVDHALKAERRLDTKPTAQCEIECRT